MLKKAIIISLIIILILSGGAFFYFLNVISRPASKNSENITFVIEEGEGVKEISHRLKEQGLITNDIIFQTYLWLKKYGGKLQAGEYSLSRSLTLVDLGRILVTGEALSKERVIKIIEGWSNKEIAEYLGEIYADGNSDLKANYIKEFLQASGVTDSREIIAEKSYTFLADKSPNQDLEGFLFPDTYRVFKDLKPADIIEKMLDNFDQKLTPELRAEIEKQDKTVFEIVTMASIVEQEVRGAGDRKIAAGIFYKRLEQGIPLESDATVNYITGKQALQPTLEDTRVESPYNTYLNKGLPPGPIGNPGLDTIKAAIYPEKTDYLFFLTKPDGSAVFSKTYEEHLQNKNKYLK